MIVDMTGAFDLADANDDVRAVFVTGLEEGFAQAQIFPPAALRLIAGRRKQLSARKAKSAIFIVTVADG
jgi:hypothetical protein